MSWWGNFDQISRTCSCKIYFLSTHATFDFLAISAPVPALQFGKRAESYNSFILYASAATSIYAPDQATTATRLPPFTLADLSSHSTPRLALY